MANENEQLKPTITVKVNGNDREFFMPFGLLSAAAKVCKDIDTLGLVLMDAELSDDLLKVVLAERTKTGKLMKEVDLDEIEIDPKDATKLMTWAADHVLDFFIAKLETVTSLTKKYEPRVKILQSSQTGQEG